MENKNAFAPIVEEIARVLEDKNVSREEIENELHVYIDEYHVDPFVAKRSIVHKYGGDPTLLGGFEWIKIASMSPTNNVNFLARVVTANLKEIDGDSGPRKIVYGIFGDDTGTVPFTLWEGEFPYEKGDV
ncbi:MAG: DNA-binding protein, partial [Candidatus Thermoplasmatota archaeon]|nr:DNA-binding protein [Candidatus Thermoplasmatota archaeon]